MQILYRPQSAIVRMVDSVLVLQLAGLLILLFAQIKHSIRNIKYQNKLISKEWYQLEKLHKLRIQDWFALMSQLGSASEAAGAGTA